MYLPSDYEEIETAKTAVRDFSSFDAEDRNSRLEIGYYDVFGKKPAELLALISSLEIRLLFEDR